MAQITGFGDVVVLFGIITLAYLLASLITGKEGR